MKLMPWVTNNLCNACNLENVEMLSPSKEMKKILLCVSLAYTLTLSQTGKNRLF